METHAEAAVALLTRDILSGMLPPDSKLKIRELAESYAIGASPLREALSQLAARGLVHQRGQRGFRVPPVTREQLLDITHSRQIVESEAFRLAMAEGDSEWEDAIVSSFHLLRRAGTRQDGSAGALDDYERHHHAFHRALIAACPFKMLLAFCDELYSQKTRYRRFLLRHRSPQEMTARHELLMTYALDRDPRGLAEIKDHIGSTATELLALLAGG